MPHYCRNGRMKMISELVLEKSQAQRLCFESIWQTVENADDFLGYRIHVRLRHDATGGVVGYVAQLRGVVSEGDDVVSAMQNVVEAFRACVETYEDEHMPIPWSESSPKE